jgi:endonuclease/exonuclease/phosphatase family metal-dependent hydrolase
MFIISKFTTTQNCAMIRKLVILFVLPFVLATANAQTLRVATYNMRYDNPGDSLNPWKQRLPVIVQMIQFHNFDIFGGQELMSHQVDGLIKELPGYAVTGVAREDGEKKGEFSHVFYKTDKFRLLKKGTFWLSETPDKPSKGWDAALARICSWGEFEEIATKRKFYFFNTHFDHRGAQARIESAQLILGKIKAIAGSSPVILTGDFNFDQDSEGFTKLKSGELKDAFTLAKIKMLHNGTFNSFNINSKTERRIDHILVSSHFKPIRYGILTDSYNGKFPSDHFPVVVEMQ